MIYILVDISLSSGSAAVRCTHAKYNRDICYCKYLNLTQLLTARLDPEKTHSFILKQFTFVKRVQWSRTLSYDLNVSRSVLGFGM